jgi:SAM-dependent methyltransferase
MEEAYDEATYGERVAEVYDDWHPATSGAEVVVAALRELAGPGPVLELGIGTGRIALPLAAAGVEVHGIDASPAMVAKLRAKPGGERIPVTLGNFAEVGMDGAFSLVYVVFNTFFALLSQDEQVRCFANVAAHLTEGGLFVIEAFVPDPTRFSRHQIIQVTQVGTDYVKLETSRHDPVAQRTTSHHIVITEAGIRLYPVQVRYAWPAELDLMARLAGMRLRERWGGFRREPFTAASASHVSIYERV